jgi:trk system potassium uptake protein TrkH
MGIVVLFVAILPVLQAGGKQLFKSEVLGPVADSLRPRVSETASTLWKIYLSISFILTIALYLQGMTFYDALCHSFATMATGGYSTKNASVGYYASAGIDWTITIFMILAGTNFGLYFRYFGGDFKVFQRESEWRFFIGIIAVSVVLITVDLLSAGARGRPAG